MSKAYVSLLESGSGGVNPKLPTLERLAATLAVPLPWLAFGEGPDPEWDAPAAPAEPQAEAAG